MLRSALALTASLSLALLGGCDTASPTAGDATNSDGTSGASGCRVEADCAPNGAQYCRAPGAAPATCGICRQAERLCETDDECGADSYCRNYVDSCVLSYCNGGDLRSSMCTAKCTPDGCGAGTTCAADGRCKADPCADGSYACPAATQCDAGASGADAHGCVRATCAPANGDADCGAGAFCVEGMCYPTLGQCTPRAA